MSEEAPTPPDPAPQTGEPTQEPPRKSSGPTAAKPMGPGDRRKRKERQADKEQRHFGMGRVPSTTKADKAPNLHVTVFRRGGGGPPYVVDVEVEDGGHFRFEEAGMSYQVSPGSVWKEGDKYRALVNEGNPKTICPDSLTGDDEFGPEALDGIISNNLWWQFEEANRSRSLWPKIGMGMLALFAIALLVLLWWNNKTLSGDLQDLQQALEGIRAATGNSGAAGSDAANAGHQTIAPGSR